MTSSRRTAPILLAAPMLLALASGCRTPAALEGGANANDRTWGGRQGEELLTGAMTVSPRGDYVFAQRNAVGLLYDLGAKRAIELDFQPNRFVFSRTRAFAYALAPDGAVVGVDLATAKRTWQTAPLPGTSLLQIAADDSSLVQGDAANVRVIDPATGAIRVTEALGGVASFATFLPVSNKVLVASDTTFTDHKPKTKLLLVTLGAPAPMATVVPTVPTTVPTTIPSTLPTTVPTTFPSTLPTTMPSTLPTTIPPFPGMPIPGATRANAAPTTTPAPAVAAPPSAPPVRLEVPNCTAPIAVLPDESRAFLSPTFCAEDVPADQTQTWTNPDPVSVIDLGAAPAFVKNLPGFGPLAMPKDGARAVAYLDMERIDPSMFSDPAQIPAKGGAQYHLMIIEPRSLGFTLTPIGDALPRFALSRDGKGLLVDASIKVKKRAKAKITGALTLGPQGIGFKANVSIGVFNEQAPFGWFDLDGRKFTPFAGPLAGLDRFVQLSDGPVVTLMRRDDGLGGYPFTIDVGTRATANMQVGTSNSGLRDVGLLLADGKTVVLRLRLAASNKANKLYSREALCLTTDLGKTCGGGYIEYEASTSFADADPEGSCPGGHDCW